MTRLTLRIDFENGSQIGHGKVRLLELIAEHGSISRAAREMGMSYRRAWLLTDQMNRMFTTPVIETQHGGSGGGAARLTSFGHAVIGHYRAIETQAMKLFSKQLAELESGLSTDAACRQ
ncbi:MAG: winged helix-turn-helix domain-containing protein [Hyphomicrobiaceae bacterium]